MPEILIAILSLSGVIGLIFLTYYASRWLNKRFSAASGKSIKILERANFSQDKSVVIIKVGSKVMLLGVTAQHIDKISDLDESDLTVLTENVTPVVNGSFLENLKKATLEHQLIKPFIPKDKQGEQNDEE